MNKDLREDLFDTILASAFGEFVDGETDSLPSREELAKMYPVPRDGLRKIKRIIKRSRSKSGAIVYLQRVAVVFLAAVTLFAGVMAMSTDVRSAVSRTVISWFDKFVSISFDNGSAMSADDGINASSFEIGYVPEGMELVSNIYDEERTRYSYTGADGEYLYISIHSTTSTVHYMDTELSEFDAVSINDSEGYMYYVEDEKTGVVILKKGSHTVSISCMLDKSEMIKIAENIKIEEKN